MQHIDNSSSRRLWALVFSVLFPFFASAQSPNASAPLPQVRITRAIDGSPLVTLAGNRHPLARPEFDSGPAPESLPMERMLLVLKRSAEQEAALETLMAQQQEASSPNYHKWLTPAEFGEQFGPADQDVQTIASWLTSQGFQVSGISHGKMVIEFSGTAGQVQRAFHAAIHKFVVNGEEHWANAADPQIPSALAAVVVGVNTLHNFGKHANYHLAGEFATSTSGIVQPVRPMFTASGCNGSCYAVGPTDFATIYNVVPLWNTSPTAIDGTGQTIAIVGETDINIQDVASFRSMFGLPAAKVNIIHDGTDPGILTDGEETEADLDVEWSGAVAKGATVDLVVSASTNTAAGVDLSAQYIIDNNVAPVMSDSYGLCELGLGTAGNQFYNQLWQQAAAQGITVVVASGDSGAAGCDNDGATTPAPAEFGLAVSGLASTPYNIAVGGTDFIEFTNAATYWNPSNSSGTLASAKGYIPETTWNNTCTNALFGTALGYSTNSETNCNNSKLSSFVSTVGGSGGASNCTTSNGSTVSSCAGGYAKPSWQAGTGVPSDNVRDVPDVSLFASNGFEGSFYVVCEADQTSGHTCSASGSFLGVGGTSASAPAFAGIMALVNEKTQTPQGNANYVLYKLAAQQPSAFNDVTAGTIAMPCAKNSPNCTFSNGNDTYGILSGYNTTTGFDLATGLGSVNANNLVTGWTNLASGLTATNTTLALNPSTNPFVHGTSVPVSISVAPSQGSGTPTGRVSLITSNGTDVADFTLSNGSISTATSLFPGGSYTVTAHYAGDGTFAASNSSAVSITVTPEGSVTNAAALSFGGNGSLMAVSSGPYGGVFLDAAVQGQSGAGNATGTVNFTVDGQGVSGNPFSLNASGQAVMPTGLTAAPGSHSFAASYSGDASFNASTSATGSVTITKAPTTIMVASSSSSVNVGASVTLSATISTSSFGNAPTGTVSFFSGGTPIGNPVILSAGTAGGLGITASATASLATTQLPIGSDNITAQYSGDGNYLTSASSPVTVGVTGPTFGFTVTPSVILVASPGGSATATLAFTGTNGFSGTITLSASACSGLPAQSSCSFNPSTVTLSSNAPTAAATLSITTTAAASAVPWLIYQPKRPLPPSMIGIGLAVLVFAGLCILALPRQSRFWCTSAAFALVAGLLISGCGSTKSNSDGTATPSSTGTPISTSAVTITVTGGSVTQVANVTLSVE